MTGSIDRRRFLQQAGVAAGATGAIWAAPSIIGSSSAFAIGSVAANCPAGGGGYKVDWSKFTTGTLTGTSVQNLPVYTFGGVSAGFDITMQVTIIGGAIGDPLGLKNGWDLNQVRPGAFNGVNANFYGLSMYGNGLSGSTHTFTGNFGMDVTFTWPAAHTANGLTFSIGDIDNNDTSAYRDFVWVDTAPSGITKAPAINGSGTAAAPWYTTNGQSSDGTANGNVTLTYPTTTALTSLTISYRNHVPGTTRYTGDEQHIGILNLNWCK